MSPRRERKEGYAVLPALFGERLLHGVVLLLLLRYKNMTVTREQLMTEVWGYDYVGETRVLDIKIFSLRKKLGLGDAIRTLPKLGYRLEDR